MKTHINSKLIREFTVLFFIFFTFFNLLFGISVVRGDSPIQQDNTSLQMQNKSHNSDIKVFWDALRKINKGRKTFRYDTFGDDAF